MDKNIINIALFGLGRIGQMHAENLINHPEFNLKYIFDIDKKLSKKLSKKYQSTFIESPSIAFKDKSIKSIFISTVNLSDTFLSLGLLLLTSIRCLFPTISLSPFEQSISNIMYLIIFI